MGLIGCGGIGRTHAAEIERLSPLAKLTAVYDARPESACGLASSHAGVLVATSVDDLLSNHQLDAVVIAAPHRFHPELALEALNKGVHVFVEKPIAISATDARAMLNAAREKPDLKFAVGLNQRTWPIWNRVHSLIASGTLGKLVRISWTITDWYRTQAYFSASDWRGTWAGEGGGLLVNQCPHNLDLLLWFAGAQSLVPRWVFSDITLGKHHDIETEDEVHALIGFDDQLVASFIASTGEGVASNQLVIVGDRATIVVDGHRTLSIITPEVAASTHIRTSTSPKRAPDSTTVTESFDDYTDDHFDLLRAFALSISTGTSHPLVHAEEGLASVELANAIMVSGVSKTRVALPLDATEFDTLLAQQISLSK